MSHQEEEKASAGIAVAVTVTINRTEASNMDPLEGAQTRWLALLRLQRCF